MEHFQHPRVELSPVNRVEFFLRLHGRFQPRVEMLYVPGS
jgi:hypothetical protein